MTKKPKSGDDAEVPKEIEARRDAILKRLLNTPPKPRKGRGGMKDKECKK